MTTTTAAAPVATTEDNGAPRPFRRGPYLLQVVRTERLTPSLLRVILGGEELAEYPADAAGAHIKVLVPRPGQVKPLLPVLGEGRPKWDAPQEERPFMRTYTVRWVDNKRRELALEFVLHDHGGPAASWAQNAKAGDWIAITGAGRQVEFPAACDWHLFVGDSTALPGIAARLARLPDDARGVVLIGVHDANEAFDLRHPVGIEVRWLAHADAPDGGELAAAACALDIPPTAAVYAAGEAAAMTRIRSHVRQTLGLPREQVYVLPYWKMGANEETYHHQRHEFMDADA